MEVDENTAAAKSEYKGDTYHFCSQECKRRFDADPERYVSRSESSQT
jgi:Cu+-exporting ATPase